MVLREMAVPRYYKGSDVPPVQRPKHSSQPCDGKLQKPDPMLGSYVYCGTKYSLSPRPTCTVKPSRISINGLFDVLGHVSN